jgi:multidrug resistance efflux pump
MPGYPSEEGDDRFVSRRELEQRLRALRELQATKNELHAKALELQATEYARRMDELNHAHKLAEENWARSLPRETFANFVDQWDKWRADVNDNISAFRGGMALLRFIGMAGLLALAMELLRLTGITK